MSESHQAQSPCRWWTDAEIGALQDLGDMPAKQAAMELGRTAKAVYDMRAKLRRGWSPRSEQWSPDEDALILESPHLTAAQVAERLGRSAVAVVHRRKCLSITEPRDYHAGKTGRRPHYIGNRTIIAKTCVGCGLLLDGSWFYQDRDRWNARCRKCVCVATARPGSHGGSEDFARTMHALTEPTATRARYPYTDDDLEVLANRDLSLLQMALATRRTYNGVAKARHRYGMDPIVEPSDPSQAQWFIRLRPDIATALGLAS